MASEITTLNVHLRPDTRISVVDYETHTTIDLGSSINLWTGTNDEEAVANADRLIEALHDLRIKCLARIVKAQPEPEQADPITMAKAAA